MHVTNTPHARGIACRRQLIRALGIAVIAASYLSPVHTGAAELMQPDMQQEAARMIRHTVVFSLKHPKDSAAERAFFAAAKGLADIPGVKKFEMLRQISAKCGFDYGFSMEFADQAAYDAYNADPSHVEFVQQRWMNEVAEFMEIDYVPLEK
jgi:hypothetical protein